MSEKKKVKKKKNELVCLHDHHGCLSLERLLSGSRPQLVGGEEEEEEEREGAKLLIGSVWLSQARAS